MRLRIIAGQYKGRFILAPSTIKTRPTTDRVRETLFNLLENEFSFGGANVLDLYAGSGALGFESISRGAESVTFIEQSYPVYKNLQANISSLGINDQCKVIKRSAVAFTGSTPDEPFSLILADPPFFKYDIYDVVKQIFANGFLASGGMVIVERSVQTMEKDIEGFGKEPFRKIGDTRLYRFADDSY